MLLWGCSTNTGVTTVAPNPPTNLTASVISTTQVNLQWTDNATNETGYKIQRKTTGGDFTDVASTGADIASHSDLGLTPNTTYTYRVYAYNSAGNSLQYSNEITVTTNLIPIITTSPISDTTAVSVSCGGIITSDAGSPVTARGVCWSTTSGPTIALSTKTNNGTGTGSFTSSITGLTPNTIFYIRAYATNANGTAYGNELSFRTNQQTSRNIYVVGTEANHPTIWINGISSILHTNLSTGVANSVFVSGSDVYVAGEQSDAIGLSGYPVLWKNGVISQLGTNRGAAKAVFVSGNDVYVVGYDISPEGHPVMWKNGNRILLNSNSSATAKSVFVSGNDVYVTSEGWFWKNGTITNLPGNNNGTNSIFVSGNDIYIAGYTGYPSIPMLWKNGVASILPRSNNIGSGFAESVYVFGNDIYVCGIDNSLPVYWKNGTRINLNLNTTLNCGNATCIFGVGNDIYISGSDCTTPLIWVNGVVSQLPIVNPNNEANGNSIFVTQ